MINKGLPIIMLVKPLACTLQLSPELERGFNSMAQQSGGREKIHSAAEAEYHFYTPVLKKNNRRIRIWRPAIRPAVVNNSCACHN